MRQTALAAFALALALSMQASAEPPFTPDDSGVTKVLKLVAWIGSLDDLSAATVTLPAALGVPATPRVVYYDLNGKQTKDWTEYLSNAPIWPGAQSTVQYRIPEADGPAGRARASVFIGLNSAEACIHLADMISRFGKPAETHLVTDGAGLSYSWALRQTPWKTGVGGYFGRHDKDCAASLSVGELR
jgi:hypothetical protein